MALHYNDPCMPVKALSLTTHVSAWLSSSAQPRVLHVFDQACNLINKRQEVLSVVTARIGEGPFNLVIDDGHSYFDDLSAQSPVSFSGTRLQLGKLIIHTAGAKVWNPRPDWETLHAYKSEFAIQRSHIQITNFSPQIFQFATSLTLSLATSNFSDSLTAAQKLAGLGQGLTPSGDDFLMGALYAAWIIHPPEIASELANEIANTAVPLTTSLSAAWLSSAGRGEAGILWHEFFDALVVGDELRIKESVEKILAVGETSGADALAGFVGVFSAD